MGTLPPIVGVNLVPLEGGEIDALTSPQQRRSMLSPPGDYGRLFHDVQAGEMRY